MTFKLKDGNYRVVICALVEQHRGQCNYVLVPTTYNSNKKPSVADLLDKEILGGTIGTMYSREDTLAYQPHVDRIWNTVGGNPNFFFGVVQLVVTHKDFIGFKEQFEKIGTLQIIETLKKSKQYGYEDNFDRFEDIFSDLDGHAKAFQMSKFPIKALCDV